MFQKHLKTSGVDFTAAHKDLTELKKKKHANKPRGKCINIKMFIYL